MKKGTLIVIDGADGAGKATQAKMLASRLLDEGYAVATIDFPRYGENQLGQLIREGLDGKHGDFMHLDPRIASTLYAVDRFESKAKIELWLAEDKVVIIDRYASSNMLHQGAKLTNQEDRLALVDWLNKLEFGILGLPPPDVVIYLDIPFDIRAKLVAGRGKADLSESDVQHQKDSDDCARELANVIPGWERISCVNGEGALRAPIDINREVFDLVRSKLPRS